MWRQLWSKREQRRALLHLQRVLHTPSALPLLSLRTTTAHPPAFVRCRHSPSLPKLSNTSLLSSALQQSRRAMSSTYATAVPCARFGVSTTALAHATNQPSLPPIANIYTIDLRKKSRRSRKKPNVRRVLTQVIGAHRSEVAKAAEEARSGNADAAVTPPLVFLIKTDDSPQQAARRQITVDAQLTQLNALGEFHVCVLNSAQSRRWTALVPHGDAEAPRAASSTAAAAAAATLQDAATAAPHSTAEPAAEDDDDDAAYEEVEEIVEVEVEEDEPLLVGDEVVVPEAEEAEGDGAVMASEAAQQPHGDSSNNSNNVGGGVGVGENQEAAAVGEGATPHEASTASSDTVEDKAATVADPELVEIDLDGPITVDAPEAKSEVEDVEAAESTAAAPPAAAEPSTAPGTAAAAGTGSGGSSHDGGAGGAPTAVADTTEPTDAAVPEAPSPPPPPPSSSSSSQPTTPMPAFPGVAARAYCGASTMYLSDRVLRELPVMANVLVVDRLDWTDGAATAAVDAALALVDPAVGHLFFYRHAYALQQQTTGKAGVEFSDMHVPFVLAVRTSLSTAATKALQRRLDETVQSRVPGLTAEQQRAVAAQCDRTTVCVLSAEESRKGGENPLEQPRPRQEAAAAPASAREMSGIDAGEKNTKTLGGGNAVTQDDGVPPPPPSAQAPTAQSTSTTATTTTHSSEPLLATAATRSAVGAGYIRYFTFGVFGHPSPAPSSSAAPTAAATLVEPVMPPSRVPLTFSAFESLTYGTTQAAHAQARRKRRSKAEVESEDASTSADGVAAASASASVAANSAATMEEANAQGKEKAAEGGEGQKHGSPPSKAEATPGNLAVEPEGNNKKTKPTAKAGSEGAEAVSDQAILDLLEHFLKLGKKEAKSRPKKAAKRTKETLEMKSTKKKNVRQGRHSALPPVRAARTRVKAASRKKK